MARAQSALGLTFTRWARQAARAAAAAAARDASGAVLRGRAVRALGFWVSYASRRRRGREAIAAGARKMRYGLARACVTAWRAYATAARGRRDELQAADVRGRAGALGRAVRRLATHARSGRRAKMAAAYAARARLHKALVAWRAGLEVLVCAAAAVAVAGTGAWGGLVLVVRFACDCLIVRACLA